MNVYCNLFHKPVDHFNYHHKICNPEVVVVMSVCVCVCVCVYINFFSLLLDFCTNPKFNMAPIRVQKLQRVKMPKSFYCIHIFLILDSCFQFNIDAHGKVQECCGHG